MKKIMFLFVAVAALAVPSWAVVNVIATVEQVLIGGSAVDTDTIVISYENTEPNAVRAFAVDITLSPPAEDPCAAPSFVDYNKPTLSPNYWVYPGSIDINEAGLVDDVGTPIADPCILPSDTLPGLDSNGVTIEMGSLYIGTPNTPATSGVLLKLVVDDDCDIAMSGNTSRGAVVMEGIGSKATVNYIIPPWPNGPRFAPADPCDRQQWRLVGRPKCWCRFKGGRQCHGDADNAPYGKNMYYVSVPDADIFNAAQSKPYSDMVDANGVHLVEPGTGVALICADFDHLPYGKNNYRVSVPDADIFNAYNSISGGPDPNCW